MWHQLAQEDLDREESEYSEQNSPYPPSVEPKPFVCGCDCEYCPWR